MYRSLLALVISVTAVLAVGGGFSPRIGVAHADPGQPPVTIGPVSASFYSNPNNSGSFDASVLGGGPVFTQTFPVIDFNPPSSAQVACSNSTNVNEFSRPFTDVVEYSDGSCGTMVAQGGGAQAGTGSLNAFQLVATANLTVAQAGQVTFNFFSDDGWILGAGQQVGGTAQPTYVSGQHSNPPTSSESMGYPIVGSYNQPSSPAQNTVTVNFPSAGTYPIEVDYTECCGGQLSLTLGTSYGNPIPPTNPPAPPAAFTGCPTQSQVLNTSFPKIVVPALVQDKHYNIIYDPLNLTWTSSTPPNTALGQQATCTLTSNDGFLGVDIQLQFFNIGIPFTEVNVGSSEAIATLDFFTYPASASIQPCDFGFLNINPSLANNCFLTSGTPKPGDHIVRWHTDHFTFHDRFGIASIPTSPYTFYVDIDQLQGSSTDIATELQPVELYIHQTLIQHLPAINRITVIQDPPANVLVRDPNGLVTGQTAAGNVVTQIPGSQYVSTPNGTAVILVNPPDGAYGVQVNGAANSSFYLSMSTTNLQPDGLHPTTQETIEQQNLNAQGIQAYCYTVPTGAACSAPSTTPFAFFPSTPNTSVKGNQAGKDTRLKIDASADAAGTTSGNLSASDNRLTAWPSPVTITDGNIDSIICTGTNSAIAYGSATFNGSPIYFLLSVKGHVVGTPSDPQAHTYRVQASNGYDSGDITIQALQLTGC